MGFWSKLFKKKEGGTTFGNILRAVGNHYTGGLYSIAFPVPLSMRTTEGFAILFPHLTPEAQAQTQRGFFDNIVIPNLGNVIGVVAGNLDTGVWLEDTIPDAVINLLDDLTGPDAEVVVAESVGMDVYGNVVNSDIVDDINNNPIPGGLPPYISADGSVIDNNTQTTNNANSPSSSTPNAISSTVKGWFDKTLSWVKSNVMLAIGVPVAVGVALYFGYKYLIKK